MRMLLTVSAVTALLAVAGVRAQQPQAVDGPAAQQPEPVAVPQPAPPPAPMTSVRLKDIASIQGEITTPLVGYGLVVGLNKTGDRRQTIFPAQTLAAMLERFGQSVPAAALKVEKIAAGMVTAQLGPY